MADIWIKAKVKGEKEKELDMLANTGADIVVLPPKVIDEISPKSLGDEEEIEVGGGIKIKGRPYLVYIEISDESGKKKGKEVVAFKVEGQRIPLFGSVALAEFGVVLYPKEGKYKLE
jgi:predicted aspartyl protease